MAQRGRHLHQSEGHHYIPAFDGLRAIAIIPVILLHVSVNMLGRESELRRILTRGWYGVDLFFVLSGFLITWILTQEMDATGTVSLRSFYSRRFLRLGPAYISTLLALLAATTLLRPASLSKITAVAPSLLTYTYNYQIAFDGAHVDLVVVVWSLCVEEQFYLAWPLIVRTLGKSKALYFCIAAVLTVALYRSALYMASNWRHLASPTPTSQLRIYFSTDTRIDVILVGCLAALALQNETFGRLCKKMQSLEWSPYAAGAAVLLCIVWLTGGRPSSTSVRSATVGYTIGAIAVAGLMLSIFLSPESLVARTLSCRPLVAVGKVSYGIYLFHLLVFWAVLHLITPETWFEAEVQKSSPQPTASVVAMTVPGKTAVPSRMREALVYLSNEHLLKFMIVFSAVVVTTFCLAWLHFRFVERKFMMLRPRVTYRAVIPGREK